MVSKRPHTFLDRGGLFHQRTKLGVNDLIKKKKKKTLKEKVLLKSFRVPEKKFRCKSKMRLNQI